jgi:hypothetical protein
MPNAESIPSVDQHDAGQFNWNGFACPYCGASSFVKCSGGHLACDGPGEMRNDRHFHRCFCGAAGYIEGHIESFHDRRQSVAPGATPKQSAPTVRVRSGDPAVPALPSPQGRPPAKR